jgi:hypothetical protein
MRDHQLVIERNTFTSTVTATDTSCERVRSPPTTGHFVIVAASAMPRCSSSKSVPGWRTDGHHAPARAPAHGGQVRDGRRDRLKSQVLQWEKGRIEVYAQHGDVGTYQGISSKWR